MVDEVALGQVFLQVFPLVNIIPPVLRIHCQLRCSYQKDKRTKPGNLPKSNGVPENGEHWIEEYSHICLVVRRLMAIH
jgi:hypothetical protein